VSLKAFAGWIPVRKHDPTPSSSRRTGAIAHRSYCHLSFTKQASAEKLLIKVQEFIVHRMPEEAADRVALREWAEAELTKLEERAPGGWVNLGRHIPCLIFLRACNQCATNAVGAI
jgi:hypothetical protein